MMLRSHGWIGLVIGMCLAAAPYAAAQTPPNTAEAPPPATAVPPATTAPSAQQAAVPPALVPTVPKPPAAMRATSKPASSTAGEQKPATPAVAKSKARAKSPTVKCNVPNSAGKPYYVEFRARTAVSFGHTFVVYGKASSTGGAATWEVTGLHPAGDDPNTYAMGLMVPVPAETGLSDGDLDEEYVAARWCVRLSEPEYRKMVSFIKELKSRSSTWHGPSVNCNSYVGDIARAIGLDAPSTGLIYPEVFVNSIKSMNTGGSQLPNIPTVQWNTVPAAAINSSRGHNP